MNQLSARLHDPNYDMKKDHTLPVNAFLEPNNPFAVFPQTKKPEIFDFRSHKMENGGLTAWGTFRKALSNKSKKSRWDSVVKTREMIEREEREKAGMPEELMSDEEIIVGQSTKVTTADDLTHMMSGVIIDKNKKKKELKEKAKQRNVSMEIEKGAGKNNKSKAIKKKESRRKSKK